MAANCRRAYRKRCLPTVKSSCFSRRAPNEIRSVCACVCVWPHDDMNDHSADAHIDQD